MNLQCSAQGHVPLTAELKELPWYAKRQGKAAPSSKWYLRIWMPLDIFELKKNNITSLLWGPAASDWGSRRYTRQYFFKKKANFHEPKTAIPLTRWPTIFECIVLSVESTASGPSHIDIIKSMGTREKFVISRISLYEVMELLVSLCRLHLELWISSLYR